LMIGTPGSGNEWTVGNGTLIVTVYYAVLTLG